MSIEKDRIKELSEMVKNAKLAHAQALKECIAFSLEHCLSFTWDDTYGSRRQEFVPKGDERFEDYAGDYVYEEADGGVWVHSSNC